MVIVSCCGPQHLGHSVTYQLELLLVLLALTSKLFSVLGHVFESDQSDKELPSPFICDGLSAHVKIPSLARVRLDQPDLLVAKGLLRST